MKKKDKIKELEKRITELEKDMEIPIKKLLIDMVVLFLTIILTPLLLFVWSFYAVYLYYGVAKDFYYCTRYGGKSYNDVKIILPTLKR